MDRGTMPGKVQIQRNGESVWISGKSTLARHPNRALQQRLQFYQPSDEVLEWLAGRNDVRLTYLELSLDLIFKNEMNLGRRLSVHL